MSTKQKCEFIEVEPNQWFYILEHEHVAKTSPDWREHANAYGPFATYDTASDHLDQCPKHPGAHFYLPYPTRPPMDEILLKLIATAISPAELTLSMT